MSLCRGATIRGAGQGPLERPRCGRARLRIRGRRRPRPGAADLGDELVEPARVGAHDPVALPTGPPPQRLGPAGHPAIDGRGSGQGGAIERRGGVGMDLFLARRIFAAGPLRIDGGRAVSVPAADDVAVGAALVDLAVLEPALATLVGRALVAPESRAPVGSGPRTRRSRAARPSGTGATGPCSGRRRATAGRWWRRSGTRACRSRRRTRRRRRACTGCGPRPRPARGPRGRWPGAGCRRGRRHRRSRPCTRASRGRSLATCPARCRRDRRGSRPTARTASRRRPGMLSGTPAPRRRGRAAPGRP